MSGNLISVEEWNALIMLSQQIIPLSCYRLLGTYTAVRAVQIKIYQLSKTF